MSPLFPKATKLDLPDSDITYFPGFFNLNESDDFFCTLKNTVEWKQDKITVFGKQYAQPRLTALYGNNGKPYSYSNITMLPKEFPPELLYIKQRIEHWVKVEFTTCLMNLYRDGKDSNGWHADNEKELGINPIIASVTFGQERFFYLKYKTNKVLKHKILLGHGSLLLMKGSTQYYWLHQLPKTARPIGERINLTFRIIR